MKNKRLVLAVAIILTTAACSADVTAPERASIDAYQDVLTQEQTTPTPTDPEEPTEPNGGYIGSGVGR
jgi:uncharacterized lipoprotein